VSSTHPAPNASQDSTGLLGLREMSEALEAWQAHPGPESHAQLDAAFERVIGSSGLGGGHIHLDAPPLTEVELRTGSLIDQNAETAGLRAYKLRFGDRVIATLHLDAPPAAVFSVDECARGLEIVLGSAWSRARAGQATDELAALDTATRGIAGVHAQYAALGIVDQDFGIERFITSGVSRAERERIGPPPHGHGLLGAIARETQPVRVHDIGTDTRRFGFPANHPPMSSLLGVPIGAKGRSIGRLYLTNKLPSGDFTEDDERLVEMFALHAGIAIENARLHEQVQRLAIVEERERIARRAGHRLARPVDPRHPQLHLRPPPGASRAGRPRRRPRRTRRRVPRQQHGGRRSRDRSGPRH
jgi:hypothetical protein